MDIVIKLLPMLALVAVGYILKMRGLFDTDFGRMLLRFVLVVASPALALRSISQLQFDTSLLAIIILPVVLTAVSFALVKPLEKKVQLKPQQFAVFLMATMAVNSGFVLPFLVSLAGDAGAARLSLFNVMNNVMIFGWVYAIAIAYGNHGQLSKIEVAKKVAFTPVFAAILIALAMNLGGVAIPDWLSPTVNLLANLTVPLILLALGLLLELRLVFPIQTLQSLCIRMLGGLAIGIVFVELFSLTGVDRIAVLLLSAAPVGFNTITFSSLEKLDDKFAASIVSAGLVVGLMLMTALTIFLS